MICPTQKNLITGTTSKKYKFDQGKEQVDMNAFTVVLDNSNDEKDNGSSYSVTENNDDSELYLEIEIDDSTFDKDPCLFTGFTIISL